MKKRIVNVLLSAAVVTSMMFSVTACGSKDADTSAQAPVENVAVEDNNNAAPETAAAEDNAAAESTAAETEASDSMSAADWAASDTAATYVDLLDAMFGGQMTTAFRADGDALVLVVTLTEEMLDVSGDDITDEQMEAMQAAMQEQYDQTADQFVPIRDELRSELGDDSATIRIAYELSDGTELFSQDL